MNALSIQNTTPEVTIHEGKAVTTSMAVAEYFHKRHDDVMKKIRSVIADCEPDYHARNFAEMFQEVEVANGAVRKSPYFELTRDAFVLIVMGFTGKKALQWKIDYINAFNRMETAITGMVEKHNEITTEEREAYNVECLALHYRKLLDAWKNQIYPALRQIESPVAARLNDHFIDGYAFLGHVENSAKGKLKPGQKPRVIK